MTIAIALLTAFAAEVACGQTPLAVPRMSNAIELPPAKLIGSPVPAIITKGHSYTAQQGILGQGPAPDHQNPLGAPPWSWEHWWHPRRDMVQRHAYYPEAHGLFNMHPQNYKHIARDQAFMRKVGGDPRNPYSNQIFQSLMDSVPSTMDAGEEKEPERVPARLPEPVPAE